MGILGELNQMAKTGQVDQLHYYLNDALAPNHEPKGHIAAYIGMNDPRIAGAYRRASHHDMEISIASSYR
ncbi:MAG: hypothetical protein Q4D42_01305 [Eubacteriales bacterium]|nr:hypothetical protein [Eubacteriales bacterium]